jgi:hypothetical protein
MFSNPHRSNLLITAHSHELNCFLIAPAPFTMTKHLLAVVSVKIHYQKGLILCLGACLLQCVLDAHKYQRLLEELEKLAYVNNFVKTLELFPPFSEGALSLQVLKVLIHDQLLVFEQSKDLLLGNFQLVL